MHEIPAFHSTGHGSSVLLSDGNCLAMRCPASVSNAIVFSSRPLVVNQKIRLELTTTNEWSVSGNLRLGLTCADPSALTGADLPEYAVPDLAERENFWVKTVDKYLGDCVPRYVTLCYTSEGTLMFGPDRETKVVLLRNVPVDRHVWLVIDIYGRTTGVRIVQPDDVPSEILALGPSSVRSYETACQAGYQTVYRTRLVVFGRDLAGKNCVKSRLLGSSIGGKFGLSTSTIDLSASCSFSLSNQSKWKMATSSEEIFPANATTEYDDNFNEDAESNNVAIATNIALEILHKRKPGIREDVTPTRQNICKDSVIFQSPSTQTNTRLSLSSTKNPRTESTTDLIENDEEPPVGFETIGTDEAELVHLKDLPRDVVSLVQDILANANRRRQRTMGTQSFCRPSYQRLNNSWPQREGDILFNVLDCSGDEAYFATNQVYLSSRAIYVLVFDLCKDLEERCPAPSQNKIDDQEQDAIGEGAMSSLDYLDFWLRTIRAHASMASTTSSGSAGAAASVDLPPVFIIGSNKDGLHADRNEQQKLVEEKFDCLRRAIEGRPYEDQVIRQYYAISSHSEMESDIEQIDLLRFHIEAIARSLPYMGEFLPTRWLNFEQAVDRLVAAGTNFCSVGQLHEVALEEGIRASDEFETVVQFYHELGLLIHFGSTGVQCLSNSVIINPLWLVDVCKSILAADDHISHLIKKPVDEVASRQYNLNGILYESLLDLLLGKSLDQRSVVIGCMEKLDLIVERSLANKNCQLEKKSGRSFVVPLRIGTLPDKVLYRPRSQDVIFYYDFCGFLPDVLFYRILAHAYRWSQSFGGNEPQLVRGRGRFYFDREHDFVLALAPKHLARIKVVILRVSFLDSDESDGSVEEDKTDAPPKPYVTAKVRNFLELTLCELREKWMKRLAYRAYVQCWCDKSCVTHCTVRCTEDDCLHFLSLDECLSNKVVYCDHRRCKTSVFRKGFPTFRHIGNQKPVLVDRNLHIQDNGKTKAVELPIWVKSAAKLLNGGSDDWIALAQKFGYKRNKIEIFNYDANPALALITDWIVSSGNTALSIDMMISFLEQMHRDDIVEVIQKGQEVEENPPQVFISYQWEVQDEVAVLREVLERNGLTCWMDIGQMGGGDHLYAKVYEGIKNSKVLIACLTHKYVVSHYCSRELALADLLHKPIIPVLFEMVAWPPPGPMALIFSTLVYVNLKGVGGHGGSGIHADLDAKYQEIVTRVSNHATPRLKPFVRLSPLSSSEDQSVNEYIAPSSAPGQQRSSNFYTPYSLHSELHSSRHQTSHVGIRGAYRTSGPDGLVHHVAPVHVAKCVMCTLL